MSAESAKGARNLEDQYWRGRKDIRDLHQEGDIPGATVVRWAGQTIDGLGFLHRRDVLQAEIGCHNLLLDRRKHLKLCDFAPQLTARSLQSTMRVVGLNVATAILALAMRCCQLQSHRIPRSTRS